MAASVFRSSTRTALRSGASATKGLTGMTFARGKATLPDLSCKLDISLNASLRHCPLFAHLTSQDDYGALEPSISGKIMEIHHKGHHQTYVNNLNAAVENLQQAITKNDTASQVALKGAINFNGGGHLNHTLFWENLAPKSAGGGEPPSGALNKAINDTYGGLDQLKTQMNTALAGIQGSGWAWLVKDNNTGQIGIRTYAVSENIPLMMCC